MIADFENFRPTIHTTAFVERSAAVIGRVELGAQSSVWFGSVLRGDVESIRVGQRTNIQDMSVVHVTTDRFPTILGDDVTVGHRVVLHGCTIGNRVLVGIGAIVLDQAEIGEDCMIAAGALVAPRTKIPAGHLAMGAPAVVKRPLRPEELAHLRETSEIYVRLANRYRAGFSPRPGGDSNQAR